MALYYCSQPGCRGHDNFATTCPPTTLPDYPPLVSFQKMLDIQPVEILGSDSVAPTEALAAETSTDDFSFGRE